MNNINWQKLAVAIIIAIIVALCVSLFVCDNYTRIGIFVEISSTVFLGGVSLYILSKNREDDKVKKENINRKESFERMQLVLEQNFSILDYESVVFAMQVMRINQTQALDILFALLRQVETQGHRYDLNMPYSYDEDCVRRYAQTFNKCLKEYGHFINDLILICHLQQMIFSNKCDKSTINNELVAMTKVFEVSPDSGEIMFAENGLLRKLREIPDNEDFVDSVICAIDERTSDIMKLHSMKQELSEVGLALVEKKREELNSVHLEN